MTPPPDNNAASCFVCRRAQPGWDAAHLARGFATAADAIAHLREQYQPGEGETTDAFVAWRVGVERWIERRYEPWPPLASAGRSTVAELVSNVAANLRLDEGVEKR